MRIYACSIDDINDGYVWLSQAGLPSRAVVKITNPNSGRSIYCEALQFEENFIRHYNEAPGRVRIEDREGSVVMSGWYRSRLGDLKTQQDYPLGVTLADSIAGKVMACIDHPQVAMRVAVWLGIISVALGLVGVVLGMMSVRI